jgi:endonuclease YncB( thermonuclease family)
MGVSRALVVVAVVAAAGSLAVAALGSTPFAKRGTVTQVVDAETIAVRLVGGTGTRVRVLGIEAPAAASCGFAAATTDLGGLAVGRLAWLVGDRSQPVHDAQGRLIAYVVLPGGLDLGLELIKRGDAQVDPAARRFKQLHAYRKAQAKAEAASLGMWACGTGVTPPPTHGKGANGNPHSAPADVAPPHEHGNGSKNR